MAASALPALRVGLVSACLLLAVSSLHAQPFLLYGPDYGMPPPALVPPPAPPPEPAPPLLPTSNVGLIDITLPMDVARLRFDAAGHFDRPTRAEYFFAATGPRNKGLPLRERVISQMQEVSGYAECVLYPNLSAFLEAPVRVVNPGVNESHGGLGDLQAGMKFAAIREPDFALSLTARVFAPTAAAHDGLGTAHASIQPGALLNWRPYDLFLVEGELHLWVPLAAPDFGGDVLRYGVGISYGDRPEGRFWLAPVVECVGWSVLDGRENILTNRNRFQVVQSKGDTIVNLQLGLRAGYGRQGDLYLGYGRALTGEAWYRELLRLELRWFF